MPTLTISGCCLTWTPSEPPSCAPSASAWSTQARLGAPAIQWAALGPAETRRAATAAAATQATQAALLRHADITGAGFRCRQAAPERVGAPRDGLRYQAGVLDTVGPSVGRGKRALLTEQVAPPARTAGPKLRKRQLRLRNVRTMGTPARDQRLSVKNTYRGILPMSGSLPGSRTPVRRSCSRRTASPGRTRPAVARSVVGHQAGPRRVARMRGE